MFFTKQKNQKEIIQRRYSDVTEKIIAGRVFIKESIEYTN